MNVYMVIEDSGDNTISYGIDVSKYLLGVFSTYENAKSYVINLCSKNDGTEDQYKYYSGGYLPSNDGEPSSIFEEFEIDDYEDLDGSCAVLDIIEVPIDQQVRYCIASALYVE